MLREVSKGYKSLEDICVICCKPENTVVMKHPLFEGGVCQNCKKTAGKIKAVYKKKNNSICILCGQGGSLVYCCSSLCLSVYCEICIDYMSPKGSYSKIVADNNWNCYFCDPGHNAGSLIKRRELYSSMYAESPSVPDMKKPIRVMSNTFTACSVLKKLKIAVDIYRKESSNHVEPNNSNKKRFYSDFSSDEMLEISADFIYSSFFVPVSVADNRKKALELFLISFYQFIYRLSCVRLINRQVFFLLMADGIILDAEIKSRVLRFLQVDPVEIKLQTMNIFLWTNVPTKKGSKIQSQQYKGIAVEEAILEKFLQPLKIFFKPE